MLQIYSINLRQCLARFTLFYNYINIQSGMLTFTKFSLSNQTRIKFTVDISMCENIANVSSAINLSS